MGRSTVRPTDEKTDALLSQVLDSVDLDNTIILYTSDHGEHGLPV